MDIPLELVQSFSGFFICLKGDKSMKRKFVVVGSCLCSKGFEIDSYDKTAILEKAFRVAEELGCADMTKSNWWKLFDMSGKLLYERYSWSAVKKGSQA